MSEKKYKCPYCDNKYIRNKLIDHVEDEHEDLIPENQTPTQVVFNSINKKDHGTCVVCKKSTTWNEKAGKYNRLCDNPKCREKLREEFKRNATNKHGKYNFADDPKFQEKMLKGRKISSTYTFTDGGVVDYVGSYELKFLEFVDKVMEIESKDIMAPGPTIEYMYKGEKHYWITDFYYIPANLVLDIKDGGDNPNTRPMQEYREKQYAKEKAIKQLKKYNYLRLTNNNFGQFLEVLVDLKYMNLDVKEKNLITKINESATIQELSAAMSTVPPMYSSDASVLITNNLAGERNVALSSLDFNDSLLIDDDEEGIKKISKKKFKDEYKIEEQFLIEKDESYYNLLKAFLNKDDCIYKGIYSNLASFNTSLNESGIYFDSKFRPVEKDKQLEEMTSKLSRVNECIYRIGSITFIRNDKLNIENEYIPNTTLNINEFYEELINEVESHEAEFFMVTPSNNKNELDEMYNKYKSQTEDRKEKADAESLRLYGMTNRDHYHMLQSQLVNGTEVEDDEKSYDPFDQEIDESTIVQSSIFTNDLPMFTPLEFFERIEENYSCFTEDEAKDIKAWRESYALLGNGIKEPEYNKKNMRRMDILRKAIYQNNNEAIIQCGWIPEIEFNSKNRVQASKLVREKMENKDYGIISYQEACNYYNESYITEAKTSKKNKKAVSIVLCSGNSVLSEIIRKVQNTQYTHAAISLDDACEKIYSFNLLGASGKVGGLSYESIERYTKENVLNITIYTFLTSNQIYNNLQKVLNDFMKNAKNTSYSVVNLITILFNIPLELDKSMICSEFVDRVLKLANLDISNKSSSLVSPRDFDVISRSNSKIVEIFNGHPKKFKHSEVKRKIQKLKKSNLPIFEFAEYNGEVITEAKSLPIQFDSDGNLLVQNLRKLDFEQEYANSHRLLMEYDKTDNYEAMKYELAKMHFLITLLEKKIYKQGKDKSVKELKVRARYLNDFKKYLKVVNKQDPSFNFTEYFEQSPFNDAIIKIDKYTLKFGWDALSYMAKSIIK